jgi:hypothetical protein
MDALEAWTHKCLDNEPRQLRPDDRLNRLSWIIVTDASRYGWGYVAVNVKTGEVRQHGERWSYQFFIKHHQTGELRRSVFTEPHGVHNSLRHLLQPRHGMAVEHVIVGTDNTATRAGYDRGYNAVSYSMNCCVEKTQALYKDFFTFEYRYIEGILNVHADARSRGTNTSASDGEIARDLRRWAGVESNTTDAGGARRSTAAVARRAEA